MTGLTQVDMASRPPTAPTDSQSASPLPSSTVSPQSSSSPTPSKATWNTGRDAVLFGAMDKLLADGELGSSNMPKAAGYEYLARVINEKFALTLSAVQVKYRLRNLRTDYTLIQRALSESGSGGMCSTTWVINAGDEEFWKKMKEVWFSYSLIFLNLSSCVSLTAASLGQKNSKVAALEGRPLPFYPKAHALWSGTVANGEHVLDPPGSVAKETVARNVPAQAGEECESDSSVQGEEVTLSTQEHSGRKRVRKAAMAFDERLLAAVDTMSHSVAAESKSSGALALAYVKKHFSKEAQLEAAVLFSDNKSAATVFLELDVDMRASYLARMARCPVALIFDEGRNE